MLTLAATILALLPQAAPTFDQAKADPSKRAAYLESKLGALLFDKDKNPKGLIKGCFHLGDAAQLEAAKEKVKAEYKKDGREFFFAREFKTIETALASPIGKVFPYYRNGVAAGSQGKEGILLVGDLFALSNEGEAASVLEDYVGTYLLLAEDGIKVQDREVDTFVPALRQMSYVSLIPALAQAAQIEKIVKGGRKVSDAFKAELFKSYAQTYSLYSRAHAKEKKVYDDNNENTLQKEIVDTLDFIREHLQGRFAGMGLELKPVNKENHEYSVEKK
jgi:hypothetical protein